MRRGFTILAGKTIIEQGFREVDWDEIRSRRKAALKRSDWRAGKDVVLSTAWKEYRQALRDLPQNHDDANSAADAWPVMPDE